MDALKLLFTTGFGLMSLATILIVIGMGFWFRAFFNKHIAEEEARNRR
jgi:hypothetical protein